MASSCASRRRHPPGPSLPRSEEQSHPPRYGIIREAGGETLRLAWGGFNRCSNGMEDATDPGDEKGMG